MWLLETSAFQKLKQVSNNIVVTAEQQAKFEVRRDDYHNTNIPMILTLNQSVATIKITGILTQEIDYFAYHFDFNTTYREIISAIKSAEENNDIEEIILKIDSPGGNVNGLFGVVEALQKVEKPIITKVVNICCSAAFAIGAQSDKIITSNIASQIGSVGILASFYIEENEITITSSDAPKKAPDITTLEGVKIVKDQLDAMHKIFVDAIAFGRNTTSENINKNYGKGTTFLAQQALDAGMIDSIDSMQKKSKKITLKTETKMDIRTLKAQHREVYDAIFKLGINEERDRVGAHLMMGKSSGDMETAFKAVEDGSEMTRTLQAKYLSAGMNNRDIENRTADNPASNNNQSPDSEKDIGAQVVALMEERIGISNE